MTDAATRTRGEWRTALDQMTAEHEADQITVEVVAPETGRGHEAQRLPFSYINYDPNDDVVIVAVGGRDPRYPVLLRHMVYHPSGVDITENRQAVRIVEPDDTTTLVTFWATPEPSDKQHAERDQAAGPDAPPVTDRTRGSHGG